VTSLPSSLQVLSSKHAFLEEPLNSSAERQANFPSIKNWSQHCGAPHCACLLRLEVEVSDDAVVKSASYQTKSLVLNQRINRDNKTLFEPKYTTKGRPMVQQCQCGTLKSLAYAVTTYLPGQTMNKLNSMTEYSGTRSSPAFRYTILRSLDLKEPDRFNGCFDLVEEAFMALIRGYLPAKRRYPIEHEKQKNVALPFHLAQENLREQSRRINRAIESSKARDKKNRLYPGGMNDEDWINFVDEQYEEAVEPTRAAVAPGSSYFITS